MIRAVIAAFLLIISLSGALAQTGSAQSKASVTNEINTNLGDNTVDAITPSIMRQALLDMLTSSQQYSGVNPQTGTSYTIALTDYGQLVRFTSNSAVAVMLPQASLSTGFNVFNVTVYAAGAGTVTITPTISTINGGANLVLPGGQAAWIISDGTNYQIVPLNLATGSSGVNGPGSSAVGDFACWNNTTGTLLKDCGISSFANAVVNNTALKNACTAASGCPGGDAIFTNGLWRLTFGNGNGAEPLFYAPFAGACPLNAGNGDNGYQVKSADGKCWFAQFPASGASILQFGAIGDGTTDNTTAIQNAINDLPSNGYRIVIPNGDFCVFSGLTSSGTHYAPTFIGYSNQSSLIDDCNHNVTTWALSGTAYIVNVGIYGRGSRNGDSFPINFPALDLSGCSGCQIENVAILGGTYGIKCGANCGDNLILNTNVSYAYVANIYIGCANSACNLYLKRVKIDQASPNGNPGSVAGTTINNWSGSTSVTAGQVVHVTSGGAAYNIQYMTSGTTGGSAPTVLPYFQTFNDGTATAQLFGPNPFYGLQCDGGCNQAFVEDSDIGCVCYTFAVAETNNNSSTTIPTLLHIHHTNFSAYQIDVSLSAGDEFFSSNNTYGNCYLTTCIGLSLASTWGTTAAAGLYSSGDIFFNHSIGINLQGSIDLGGRMIGDEFYGMTAQALVASGDTDFIFAENKCGGAGGYGAANAQCYSITGGDYYNIVNNIVHGSTNASSPANGSGAAHSTVSGNN